MIFAGGRMKDSRPLRLCGEPFSPCFCCLLKYYTASNLRPARLIYRQMMDMLFIN